MIKSPPLFHNMNNVNVFLSSGKVHFAHTTSMHHWILYEYCMKAYIHSVGQTALQATFTIVTTFSKYITIGWSGIQSTLFRCTNITNICSWPVLKFGQPFYSWSSPSHYSMLRRNTNLKVTKANGASTAGCVVVC